MPKHQEDRKPLTPKMASKSSRTSTGNVHVHQKVDESSSITNMDDHWTPFPCRAVCQACQMLWDKKGNTELVSPCGCPGTSLHVHQSCLDSWLANYGKFKCEACQTVYSNRKIRAYKAAMSVQRANMCIFVVLMPVGTIVTVTVCLLIDATLRAREIAAAGHPELVPSNGLGIETTDFVFLCILMAAILGAAFCLTRAFSAGNGKGGEQTYVVQSGDEKHQTVPAVVLTPAYDSDI